MNAKQTEPGRSPAPTTADEAGAPDEAPAMGIERIQAASVRTTGQAARTIRRLFDVARPGAVFSAPVKAGDRTLITASEVSVAMGIGMGMGAGGEAPSETGAGGGGGGGGLSMGRPVAVIAVGPDGLEVQPIVDPTKIALAFFTAAAAMFLAWQRSRAASRR